MRELGNQVRGWCCFSRKSVDDSELSIVDLEIAKFANASMRRSTPDARPHHIARCPRSAHARPLPPRLHFQYIYNDHPPSILVYPAIDRHLRGIDISNIGHNPYSLSILEFARANARPL